MEILVDLKAALFLQRPAAWLPLFPQGTASPEHGLQHRHAVRCPRTALGSRSSSSSSRSSEEGSPNYRKKPWPTDAKNLTVAKTPCNSREKPIPVTVAKNHGYQWKKTPSPGCILCFLFGPNFAEFKKQTPTFSVMASPCTAPQTYPRRN